jgi:SAM-dependent methyltransferase
MTEAGSQARVNRQAWQRGSYVGNYANRRLIPVEVLLLARYREALSGRVLEVGSGAGRILGYLVGLGGEVHGIDISEAMVAHTRAAYPDADVRVGDLAHVSDVVDGPFSAVLAMDNVIDTFDDDERRRTLSELGRLLAPDGLLIFSSHNLAYHDGDGAVPAGMDGSRRPGRAKELMWKGLSRPIGDVVTVAFRMPRRILNHRRLSAYERRAPDHAIVNDEAHDYALLHYYIRRDDQERQLAELGYELVECLDVDGHPLPAGETSQSPWLHYIARRAPSQTSDAQN